MVVVLVITLMYTTNTQTDDAKSGYEFKIIKELKTTSVKNQFRSGTCWRFSGMSFLESEMLRMGKPEVNLLEAWFIRNVYADKVSKYVRLHGNLDFVGRKASHDVINGFKRYGIVLEKIEFVFKF